MQKVVSVHLNGHVFQVEEGGYDALREYLGRAEQQLHANPDRAEILADLEQAIADRCESRLAPRKAVVTAVEMARILEEMGPVSDGAGEESVRGTGAPRVNAGGDEARPKRLYRVPDGAMIAGVCGGLAAYLGIDVTLVRVAFVLGALLTQGVIVLAYVALMFVVPEAHTPEERAAAGPAPLNARDVVDRAKRQFARGQRAWREQRRHRRAWTHDRWGLGGLPFEPHAGMPVYGAPPWAVALLPVFGLAHVALFLIAAAAAISLVNRGGVLAWQLPADVPVWAALLVLFVAYQIVVSPIRAVTQWSRFPGPSSDPAAHAFWSAAVWLLGLAFVIWIASNHLPEIREFLQRMPDVVRAFAEAVRGFFQAANGGTATGTPATP